MEKLHEEVIELEHMPCIKELADVIEVIMTIAKQIRNDMAEVEKVRIEKYAKRGGFEKRLFLEYVE